MVSPSRSTLSRIVNEIAEYEDTDVTDLPPLYSSIDPRTINGVATAETDASIEFSYHGYQVVLDSSGDVDVTPE